MKIRLERDDTILEFERNPMPKGRFLALCGLSAAAVYAGMVAAVARLCGIPGVVVIGVATVLAVFLVKDFE